MRCPRCGGGERADREFKLVGKVVPPAWGSDGSVPPIVLVRHRRCGELGWKPADEAGKVQAKVGGR